MHGKSKGYAIHEVDDDKALKEEAEMLILSYLHEFSMVIKTS